MAKKPKPNARHVKSPLGDCFYLLPKGVRRKINKDLPHLVGKKPLEMRDIDKWLKEHKTELQG
jgi:hypothetical protein